MDRKPLPPPFPVGTRLRYVGTHQMCVRDGGGQPVPWDARGKVVGIVSTRPILRSVIAPSLDGYSVYEVEGTRRVIWPKDAHEWEVVD